MEKGFFFDKAIKKLTFAVRLEYCSKQEPEWILSLQVCLSLYLSVSQSLYLRICLHPCLPSTPLRVVTRLLVLCSLHSFSLHLSLSPCMCVCVCCIAMVGSAPMTSSSPCATTCRPRTTCSWTRSVRRCFFGTYLALLCLALPCLALPSSGLFDFLSYPVLLCYVMFCYAVLCSALLC